MSSPRLTDKPNNPETTANVFVAVDKWLRDEVTSYGVEGTIMDYPIGGKHRGKCKLSIDYERQATKGVRLVRQTTNKLGVWCSPKFSTFQPPYVAIVNTKTYGLAYLCVRLQMIHLQRANGDVFVLGSAPHWTQPRRHAEEVTFEHRVLGLVREDGVSSPVETTKRIIPADPPALCDAYDLWAMEVTLLGSKIWQRAQEGQVAA